MNHKKGFTLLECILALCLFSIVLSIALNLYLTGYQMYRKQEYQVEVEQHVRVILNRISETLRRTDQLSENVTISGSMLIIGNTRYYLLYGGVQERIGLGTNNLGQYITRFDSKLENGYLIIQIEAMAYREEAPLSMEQVLFLGGE